MPKSRAVIAAVAAILVLLAWLGWQRSRDGSTLGEGADSDGHPAAQGGRRGPDGAEGSTWDGGRIERTIADRAVRDELRRRILAGWAEGENETAAAAKRGRLPPMPPDPDGGGVDPAYIQSVIRQDMFPMARACFTELLSRQPDAGGRVEMFFKIVGDDDLGGLVDDVEINPDGGRPDAIRDERMATCIRESLSTLAFRPPPNDGWVTIGYPILFSPGGDDD